MLVLLRFSKDLKAKFKLIFKNLTKSSKIRLSKEENMEKIKYFIIKHNYKFK